ALLLATVLMRPLARWTRVAAVIAAGVLGGVGPSIKFSGGAVLVTLLASIAMAPLPARRRWRLAAAVGGLAAVTYFASFAIGLRLIGHPAAIGDVIRETQSLVGRHAGLTDMKNPWTSGWPTWILPARPLMLGRVAQTGSVRVLSTLGNLVTWWAAMATALALGWAILSRGLAVTVADGASAPGTPEPQPAAGDGVSAEGFVREHGRAALLALVTALAFLAPWILTHRDSYIYHFLPAYAALVVLLAGFAGWCARRRPFALLLFLLAVLVVAAYYAPVWSFLPTTTAAMERRLFLPAWR